ncbi:MAG: PfkB family carbohydrate kinase [Fibrobacterales bacterium]
MKKIIIYGETVVDCFEGGAQVLGGAPFNVAWHLQGLSLHPQLISALGDDALGKYSLSKMREWGLNSNSVQIHKEHPTGTVNVSINDGEPSYAIVPDVAFDYIDTPAQLSLEEDDFLYHGSVALRDSTTRNSLSTILEKNHPKRVIDINLRDPYWTVDQIQAIVEGCFCLKLNMFEMDALTNGKSAIDPKAVYSKEAALQYKTDNQISNLIVTMGIEGATFIGEDNEEYFCGPPPHVPNVIDTVGAGDAFSAVLLLGLYHDWDWHTIIDRAQEFASVIVSQNGAIHSNMTTYTDFMALWAVEAEYTKK